MTIDNERFGDSFIREIDQTKVPHGSLAVWFIGQESIIVKGGETIVYIDPYVSSFLEVEHGAVRTYQPVILPEHILNADYYLITHDHLDHLDPGTVSVTAKNNPDTQFIAPGYCRQQLLDLGVQSKKLLNADADVWLINDSIIQIKPIPAAHETLEQYENLGHRFVGYVIKLNGVTLYHSGDTTIYPGLVERLLKDKIDLGFLPINGRDAFRNQRDIVGNLTYREAAELAYLANFEYVIPLHYDVFATNAEHPGYFVDYMYQNFPEQKLHVMARNERFFYVKHF